MGLATILTKVADIALSKGGRTVMSSLGVGLISTAVSLTLVQQYISFLQSKYALIGDLAGILSLANFPYAISVIISAIVVKLTLKAKTVTLGKSSS